MSGVGWSRERERGSFWLVRFMIWLTRHLGWRIGTALLYPITLYFVVCSTGARAASRDYLGRVLGRPARLADVFRHFFTFASAILDRVFLVLDRTDSFDIKVVGLDVIEGAIGQGRGGVLLGSHLGSFEVLRLLARHSPVHVSALMYRGNSGALSRILEQLNPDLHRQVIDIGATDAMLTVRERVQAGELVGILADRAPGGQKALTTRFLGAEAAFPTGPLFLASMLDAPVVLFYGLRIGPRRYEIHFEPFADRIVLRRGSRLLDVEAWVGRYAARLEAHCRAHPFNWFNFFPFWEAATDDGLDARRTGPHLRHAPGLPAAVADAAIVREAAGD